MSRLTHFNNCGDAHMVDVGDKQSTHRIAVAEGHISMQPETLRLIESGDNKKGDVIGIARIAGIMAAKRTAELIPLCHPLALSHVDLEFSTSNQPASVSCRAVVETRGQTGVEMEALTAVQIALLTIYDMSKAVDRGMTIEKVQLIEKQGGKSGHWQRN